MIQIGDILVSDDIKEVHFVCDLHACKGACCVEGDLGAPLDETELADLDRVWPVVKKYLPESGRRAVRIQGKYVQDDEGNWTTPLVEGKECAYTLFENGVALCGIEKAWRLGKVDWPKPISCHLYPIRIHRFSQLQVDALNYDVWDICKAACKNGKALKVPLYQFLKEPLIRKYGEDFYRELVKAIEEEG